MRSRTLWNLINWGTFVLAALLGSLGWLTKAPNLLGNWFAPEKTAILRSFNKLVDGREGEIIYGSEAKALAQEINCPEFNRVESLKKLNIGWADVRRINILATYDTRPSEIIWIPIEKIKEQLSQQISKRITICGFSIYVFVVLLQLIIKIREGRNRQKWRNEPETI